MKIIISNLFCCTVIRLCFFGRILINRVWTTFLEKRHFRCHTRTSRRGSNFARSLLYLSGVRPWIDHTRLSDKGFRARISTTVLFELRNEILDKAVVPAYVSTNFYPLILDPGKVRGFTADAAPCRSRQPITRVIPDFQLFGVLNKFFGKMIELMLDKIYARDDDVANFATRFLFVMLRLLMFRAGVVAIFCWCFWRVWGSSSFLIFAQVQLSFQSWFVIHDLKYQKDEN